MNLDLVPEAHRAEVKRFPEPLLALILAELAAGNGIEESGGGFPAPPCGSLVVFTKSITTKPAKEVRAVSYPNWSHSTGFSDAAGHFFVMDPAPPPPPEPDMDAIRAAMTARESTPEVEAARNRVSQGEPPLTIREVAFGGRDPESAYERFIASMQIDYEKWREGIGYDLVAIQDAEEVERQMIEETLLGRSVAGWREVEALAALDTPRARVALQQALKQGSAEVRMAVLRHAPQLADEKRRIRAIVEALETAEVYGGLTGTMAQIEEFHPPEVLAALWQGARERPGGVAVHLAAMLLFLYGKADSTFDWNHRPFLLRFNAVDPAERAAVFQELCERVGLTPEQLPTLEKPKKKSAGRKPKSTSAKKEAGL